MFNWHPFILAVFLFITLWTHVEIQMEKKVVGDRPVIMCLQRGTRKPSCDGMCGNLLNSAEPYHHVLQRRKITDHLRRVFPLLFIYSWIITKPSSPPTYTHTLSRLNRFQTDTTLDWYATINLRHIPALACDSKDKLKNKIRAFSGLEVQSSTTHICVCVETLGRLKLYLKTQKTKCVQRGKIIRPIQLDTSKKSRRTNIR